MSTSVSWRGRLADPARIDALEEALLEFALEFGGQFHPLDPEDRARGGLLDLAPGLGRLPFAVLRDGSLATLPGECAEADGWVSADVRFAPDHDRAVLLEVLEALRDEFLPGLEIRGEAVERPVAVRQRIRRLIALPESKRPSVGQDDPEWADSRASGTEAEWDAFQRRNLRRNAGLRRSIEIAVAGGEEHGKAFEQALETEGIANPPGMEEDAEAEEDDAEEAWDPPLDDAVPESAPREFRFPPLVERSQEVVVRAMNAVQGARRPLSPEDVFCAGVLEMAGGLSQAISNDDEESEFDTPFGLIVVQLKRALRGVEFARGAVPACSRAAGPVLEQLDRDLAEFESEIRQRLSAARDDWQAAKEGGR